MSDTSGPKIGFFVLLLVIAASIDFPGNPVRKVAMSFLASLRSSTGGSGNFMK